MIFPQWILFNLRTNYESSQFFQNYETWLMMSYYSKPVIFKYAEMHPTQIKTSFAVVLFIFFAQHTGQTSPTGAVTWYQTFSACDVVSQLLLWRFPVWMKRFWHLKYSPRIVHEDGQRASTDSIHSTAKRLRLTNSIEHGLWNYHLISNERIIIIRVFTHCSEQPKPTLSSFTIV